MERDELLADDLRARVEKGARWLEEHGGEDWPDKILAAVEAGRFDMSDGRNCAVGSVLGAYGQAVPLIAAGRDLFRASDALGFSEFGLGSGEWDALEAAWVAYAREEAAWRAGGGS